MKYEIFSYPKSRRIAPYRREPVTREWLLKNVAIDEAELRQLERSVESTGREQSIDTFGDVNVYVIPEAQP